MTNARQTLLGALGVASIAVAAGIAVGLAPAALTGPVSGLDATLATGVLGSLLVGYALVQRRSNDARDGPVPLSRERSATEPGDPGESVDDALKLATGDANAPLTQEARASVREKVRVTAVRAYARRHSVDETVAAEAVAAGEWTSDVVAAAFVGDERAPPFPLRERLRGWLHPERAYRSRAERAANAVHALATEVSQ
ncbi:DUF7269 family protein [Halobacterium wangiae]|uniref:DUF7269 family protein n=1 Tax=Halobacterium wangiae TaxID=2902623 RepID=UPI001E6042C9|nr:hypothetical protein [Halobacterium wangiae]